MEASSCYPMPQATKSDNIVFKPSYILPTMSNTSFYMRSKSITIRICTQNFCACKNRYFPPLHRIPYACIHQFPPPLARRSPSETPRNGAEV